MISPSTQNSTRPQAFAALRKIARTLSSAWDLDTTLDLIVRQTTEVMLVDSCTIYLLDDDGDTLRLRATTGLASRALGRATLQVGEGMTGYAVQENRPVYAMDARRDPHFKEVREAEETPFSSLLAVPLLSETQPIGALNVQTLSPHSFTAAEVEVLSLIGDLAAGALAKAQLYDQQRRQIEELRALAQVSEAITSPQYLDDILNLVTDMTAKTMTAAVCSIFLLNESGTHLELRSAKHTSRPYRHRPPLSINQGVFGRVLTSGQPLIIHDVQSDPRYLGQDLARAEGLASLLSVPLSVRDRVIGVMNCYTAQPRDFSEEQQALFQTVANQTALAIENVRLVSNAAVVREMHHRIKNNLQTVVMLMQLQLPDAGALDTRQVLENNIQRIHSIAAVHEVLSEKGFRLVEVKEVLERIAHFTTESMTAPAQALDIRIFGEPALLATQQATALALAVNELIQNALKHAFVGQQTGRIDVSIGHSPNELIVVVRDDGVGLPAGRQPGLGLEIVETVVRDDLRGRLEIGPPSGGSSTSRGTEFVIRLPRVLSEEYADANPDR